MDAAQLTDLYSRYGYLVHRRCLMLTRTRSDAEDAFQETFLRVKRFEAPPDLESARAWLYRIAANCCFDLARKERRHDAVLSATELARSEHTGAQQDGDRRAVVGVILAQLDEETRRVGVLHHLDGFTQEEIAAQTGISRRTIGRKLAEFETLFARWWNQATGSSP